MTAMVHTDMFGDSKCTWNATHHDKHMINSHCRERNAAFSSLCNIVADYYTIINIIIVAILLEI